MYSQKVFVLQQTFSRHNIKQAFCLWLIENVLFRERKYCFYCSLSVIVLVYCSFGNV